MCSLDFNSKSVYSPSGVGGGNEETENSTPLGSLQKGSIHIVGATVEVVDRPGGQAALRILDGGGSGPITELRVGSLDEARDWAGKIQEAARSASIRDSESRRKERAMKIARELSNLVIYCRQALPHIPYLFTVLWIRIDSVRIWIRILVLMFIRIRLRSLTGSE